MYDSNDIEDVTLIDSHAGGLGFEYHDAPKLLFIVMYFLIIYCLFRAWEGTLGRWSRLLLGYMAVVVKNVKYLDY